MPTNKYVCIHGHFYQPPRENAWLETVELQEGAAPFHDWNEKINFECYAPNAVARILDRQNKIKKIVNNYSWISFNFGPTLLSWMEESDPVTYQKILEADRESVERFGGHGNALAQVYSHLIMPLANARDKETQVRWGIADFEKRFKRKPEGMWLAETAVDTNTLEVLAQHGILFTILAPRQAKAFRKTGQEEWIPLSESVDPRRAYRCNLPSGRSIALFFYDGNVSKDVAFQKLLDSGERFASRITGTLDDNDDTPQLAHIATDGESYGHHHRYGEMALAWALDYISGQGYQLTNYGAFLEKHPPEYEVQIHENSSWSCVHGVERWRSDCGCHTGGEPHWNQAWRQPLRETLDWLRDQLVPFFEEKGRPLVNDVWEVRNQYISVVLNRRKSNIQAFLKKHARHNLNNEETTTLLRLLEMQRHAILMYTSCAWFFTEISGIETDQVLQYALRAIQYARYLGGPDLEKEFEKRLAKVPGNVYENGAVSYRKNVVPSQSDMNKVGMRFAASSLFKDYADSARFLHYQVDKEVFDRRTAGVRRLAIGRISVRSRLTFSNKHFSFVVLYLDQHNMIGAISLDKSREEFDSEHQKIVEAFNSSDLGAIIHLVHAFGTKHFSFKDLAKDEKRRILQMVVNRNLPPVEAVIRDYYNDNYQLMVALEESNVPVLEGWKNIVQFVVNRELTHFFENGKMSRSKLQELANELSYWNIQLMDPEGLSLAAGKRIFSELKKTNTTADHIRALCQVIETLNGMGLKPELWKVQNLYYEMSKGYRSGQWVYASQEWKEAFGQLGRLLHFSEEWV
ncbi:MAG TPA: DUF3536 domain-containing protein [Bacteroidetes bacterium]|nr:DUF3536 domain-containing protein [Bacteroidota bacterium]